VVQHVRFKYACLECHDHVTTAPVPAAVIDNVHDIREATGRCGIHRKTGCLCGHHRKPALTTRLSDR
jgi:hypothetical protein